MKFFHLTILNGSSMVFLLISMGLYITARVDDYRWNGIFNENPFFNDTRQVLGTIKNWREEFRLFHKQFEQAHQESQDRSSLINEYFASKKNKADAVNDEQLKGEGRKPTLLDSADRRNVERSSKLEDKLYIIGLTVTGITSIIAFSLPFLKQLNAGPWSLISEYAIFIGTMGGICFILLICEANSISKTNNTYRDLGALVSPFDKISGAMLLTSCYKLSPFFDMIVKKNGWDKLRDEWAVCEGFALKVSSVILVGLSSIIYGCICSSLFSQSRTYHNGVDAVEQFEQFEGRRPSYLPAGTAIELMIQVSEHNQNGGRQEETSTNSPNELDKAKKPLAH